MTSPTRLRRCLLGVATAAALAGCGAPASVQDEVRESATSFTRLVAAGQYAPACERLAPATRTELESDADAACPAALASLRLPPATPVYRVEVYGQQAWVELRGDTMFLARTDTGWVVTAAGCLLHSGEVYECTVKGR